MRPKLYIATKNLSVMFLLEDGKNLEREARHFLHEEDKNCVPGRIVIKEVTSLDDVPTEWMNACLWGTDDEITPEQFLGDDEYKEYLRLKKKFEA
jgi:hypothetical protein